VAPLTRAILSVLKMSVALGIKRYTNTVYFTYLSGTERSAPALSGSIFAVSVRHKLPWHSVARIPLPRHIDISTVSLIHAKCVTELVRNDRQKWQHRIFVASRIVVYDSNT